MMSVKTVKVWNGTAWVNSGPAQLAAPIASAVTQSSSFGGAGVASATLASISDGIPEPFVATLLSNLEWLQVEFTAASYVTSITIGASTNTGGWAAIYINGARLQISDDGVLWSDVAVLAGFTNATGSTYTGTSIQTITVGRNARYMRVVMTGEYLAIGNFTAI